MGSLYISICSSYHVTPVAQRQSIFDNLWHISYSWIRSGRQHLLKEWDWEESTIWYLNSVKILICTVIRVDLAPKNGLPLSYFINTINYMLCLDNISYLSRLPSLNLRFLVCELSVIQLKDGKFLKRYHFWVRNPGDIWKRKKIIYW